MRPFRTEDEGLLFGVAKLAFAECDDGRTLATLERDTVFVAELAGKPAGYVAIEESAGALRIEQLCVHPAHEEEGVDCQLLDWAEGYAISTGVARLEVVVEGGNDRAAAFYRGRGFVPAGQDLPRARPAAGSVASPSSCCALALPAAASAHARLVGSKPADGAVLATAPNDVRLLFDDEVRPAGGERGRRRARPLGARRRRPAHRQRRARSSLPLRPGLPHGAYSVRWRVVSNDGHLIAGVLAFAVGAGSPRPGADARRRRRDVRSRQSSCACSSSPASSSPAAPR